MKIKTNWGEAEVNLANINSYYCHVDVWNKRYCIILIYNNTFSHSNHSNPNQNSDQITALCDDFEDMIKTCKKIHNELQYVN